MNTLYLSSETTNDQIQISTCHQSSNWNLWTWTGSSWEKPCSSFLVPKHLLFCAVDKVLKRSSSRTFWESNSSRWSMAQHAFIMDDEEVWSDTHPIYLLLNFPIYIYISIHMHETGNTSAFNVIAKMNFTPSGSWQREITLPSDRRVAAGALNQHADSIYESEAHLQTCKNASPLHFGH